MIRYKCVRYKDLTLDELYAIMVIRQTVFVVEQDCPYLDADGKDQASYHVMGTNEDGELMAYTRICPPGLAYDAYSSIGRVIVHPKARGSAEGYRLMEESIRYSDSLYEGIPNKISAQSHLEQFYKNLGYEPTGESYLEDGIPHIAMIRS